jgi:outer membrane lipoprotein-sorting protein
MRPADNIHNQIKKLQLKASADLDKRVHDEISQALAHSEKIEPAHTELTAWRTIMKSRMTKWAAAAAVIIIAALMINFEFSTSGVAWGALVEKIESVESVVYRLTTNVKMQGMPQGQTPKTETIAYYSSEYGSRVENYINDKLSFTMYLNPIENVYVTVMPEQKKFMRFTKSPDELRQISDKDDPRVMVRHMMSTEYKQLGRDNINGIDVEGIECTGPKVMGGMFEEATARLWVEIGTDFPVRIEIEGIVSGGQMEMSMVMDDFQWNVELDPALFVPDIPPDYTSSEMNLPEVNEGTAINALHLFAELTDGRYPGSLALMTLMKEITEELTKKYGLRLIGKLDDYTNAIQNILPVGSFYAQLVGAEKEAVYYGDSVTAENPEAVLLRWKISDGYYRVIFGDLTTSDVTAEQLAELEALQPK